MKMLMLTNEGRSRSDCMGDHVKHRKQSQQQTGEESESQGHSEENC